jgi:hypothetical protein
MSSRETCRLERPRQCPGLVGGRPALAAVRSGAEAVAGSYILRLLRGGGEGLGVEAGQRAIRELAAPQEGQPLVVVLESVLPVQERRQVREDHSLGLAPEHAGTPAEQVCLPHLFCNSLGRVN